MSVATGVKPGRRCRGFTLAELLVASVIMSTALVGVYALLGDAVAIRAHAVARWNELSAAEAVVTNIGNKIQNISNTTSLSTVSCSALPDGSRCLICQQPLERCRFTWRADERTGKVALYVQRKTFADEEDLSDGKKPSDPNEKAEDELWDNVRQQSVATDLDTLSVRFRETNDTTSAWQENWQGKSGQVVVWIQSQAGKQTAESVVVPQVDASFSK